MAAETIRDIMTSDPIMLPPDTPLLEAAQVMRDRNIGDVLIGEGDRLKGIVTDRDLVVRGIAEGVDVARATVGQCCSSDVITVSPDDRVHDVVELVRGKAVRRVPVVEQGHPVGIVSLGDLARDLDPGSALAEVSSAPPNR